MCISTGNFDSIFFLGFTLFLNFEIRRKWKILLKQLVSTTPLEPLNRIAWNLVVMKDMMCRCAFLQEMLIWSIWGAIYIPFFVRLPVPNIWNCHSLYTAFSSNVGAWGVWACSLFFHSILQLLNVAVSMELLTKSIFVVYFKFFQTRRKGDSGLLYFAPFSQHACKEACLLLGTVSKVINMAHGPPLVLGMAGSTSWSCPNTSPSTLSHSCWGRTSSMVSHSWKFVQNWHRFV